MAHWFPSCWLLAVCCVFVACILNPAKITMQISQLWLLGHLSLKTTSSFPSSQTKIVSNFNLPEMCCPLAGCIAFVLEAGFPEFCSSFGDLAISNARFRNNEVAQLTAWVESELTHSRIMHTRVFGEKNSRSSKAIGPS